MASFVVNLVLALCAVLILFFGCVRPNAPPRRHPLLARTLREEEECRLRRLRTMGEMVRSPAARDIARANARAQALANAEDRED